MKNRTAGGGRLSDIKRQTRAKPRATVFFTLPHTSFQGARKLCNSTRQNQNGRFHRWFGHVESDGESAHLCAYFCHLLQSEPTKTCKILQSERDKTCKITQSGGCFLCKIVRFRRFLSIYAVEINHS